MQPLLIRLAWLLACLFSAVQAAPVAVTTLPYEPRVQLGGTFYRVLGESCGAIIGVTGGAAAQLPGHTLAVCLVYSRVTSASAVASLIARTIRGNEYILTNHQIRSEWAILSYAGFEDRICDRLIFGIRQTSDRVNVGVFCLPWSWTTEKANRYAMQQVGAPTPPAPPVLPKGAFIGTSVRFMDTPYCRANITNCAAIKPAQLDTSGDSYMVHIGQSRKGTGEARVSYDLDTRLAFAASFQVNGTNLKGAEADLTAFIREWAGYAVTPAQLRSCMNLKDYDSALINKLYGINLSCQKRPEGPMFYVDKF